MPLSRRQIYRRRRLTVFGGLALLVAVGVYLPATLLAPLSAASASVLPFTPPTSAAAAITWPSYGASAVGAMSYDGVLASSGSTKPLPMASISKVATALVVLEKKPLALDESGPTIEFTSADVALYNHYASLNGSLEPVRAGLTLTELQVLQLVLVPSANNYAASLVNWAFGSSAAFVPVATSWLTDHGMKSTTMVEPTGIDPKNTSTASDLVALGKLALANPVIAKIVSMTSATIPGVGKVDNTNKLLGIDGVTGLKTGTLDKFGANLLFSAAYTFDANTIVVVGVVLGGKDHPSLDKDIQTVLTGVEAGFHEVKLATKGQKLGSYTTAWGSSDLVAATTTKALVWSSTPITATLSSKKVAEGTAGTDVGKLVFTIGPRTIEVPLDLATSIVGPGAGWRLTHPAALL